MRLRKCIAWILIITMALSISACGNKADSGKKQAQSERPISRAQAEKEAAATAPAAEKTVTYSDAEGVLTPIVDAEGNPKQTDFIINGVILMGNRHSYFETDDLDSALATFVKAGYQTEGINSSFYLNEYIGFFMDTNYEGDPADVKILAVPQKPIAEYEAMSAEELMALAEAQGFVLDYAAPDIEFNRYVGEAYVNMDLPQGKYCILFTYQGSPAYFITIDEIPEP